MSSKETMYFWWIVILVECSLSINWWSIVMKIGRGLVWWHGVALICSLYWPHVRYIWPWTKSTRLGQTLAKQSSPTSVLLTSVLRVCSNPTFIWFPYKHSIKENRWKRAFQQHKNSSGAIFFFFWKLPVPFLQPWKSYFSKKERKEGGVAWIITWKHFS